MSSIEPPRFHYQFVYLRTEKESFSLYLYKLPQIDRFCSFNTIFENEECVKFVVHCRVRSRPSIFKNQPLQGKKTGPLALLTVIRDICRHFSHEDGFESYEPNESESQVDIDQYIMDMLTKGKSSLSALMLAAIRDGNAPLYRAIYSSYDSYVNMEKNLKALHFNADASDEAFHRHCKTLWA